MLTKYINLLNRLMGEAGEEGGGGAEQDNDTGDAPAGDDAGNNEPKGDTEEGDDKGDAGDKTTGDETGEYSAFEMPEGIELDATLTDAFNPIMKEMGLTQEQAQTMATTFASIKQGETQNQQDAYTQQLDDWVTDAKADKEYGGDKFDENAGIAQDAVAKFGTPELKELLNDSGLGNHPEMIRFMYRAGLMLKEDSVGRTAPVHESKDAASILYPKN